MSGLIERLEAFQEKSEIYAGCDEDDEIWQDCGKYVLENLPDILSALKMVRGIEGLYKLGQFVEIARPDGSDDGVVVSYQDEIGNMRQAVEATLAAAVEAAAKKGEK